MARISDVLQSVGLVVDHLFEKYFVVVVAVAVVVVVVRVVLFVVSLALLPTIQPHPMLDLLFPRESCIALCSGCLEWCQCCLVLFELVNVLAIVLNLRQCFFDCLHCSLIFHVGLIIFFRWHWVQRL